VQLDLHAFVDGSQTNGAHIFVTAGGQLPAPSHVAANVCTPFAQLASRHFVDVPTKLAHIVRLLPSQLAAAHTSVAPVGQLVRLPCGAPVTGAHVPSAPATSHASHCPPHAELQQ
jgi:hypothetical protein